MINTIRSAIWDTTTAIVADTIALFSPAKAQAYRLQREVYKRNYVAAAAKGPYQLKAKGNKSADAAIIPQASTVSATLRDMDRNNPFITSVILKNSTMVVGDEIGFKSQAINADGSPNDPLSSEIERRFFKWCEDAEVSGRTLTKAFTLLENGLYMDGESIIKDVILPKAKLTRGQKNPYRVQVLERDFLDVNKGEYGIDFDDYGKPVGFYLYDKHPLGFAVAGAVPTTSRFPASDVVFLAETRRATQRRGISPLASAVFKIYGIDDLEDAELVASRAACAYGVVLTTETPETNELGYTGGNTGTTTPKDSNGKELEYIESGGIMRLKPGEKAEAFKNERPNSNFDPFVRGRHRISAASVGMSYETATGDFSQVNFSSARMGRNIEWAYVLVRQAEKKQILKTIFRKWFLYELLFGKPLDINLKEYLDDPDRFDSATFQLAGNPGIQILDEINAFEKEESMGLNSRTRWCAERGRDFQEIQRERLNEKKFTEGIGFPYESPAKPGAATAPANADQIAKEAAKDASKKP